MGYSFDKKIKAELIKEAEREAKRKCAEKLQKATERAMYRVQRDFYTEVSKKIAEKTGHENLSQACFAVLVQEEDGIDVIIKYDASFIDGIYESNSSYHQSGDKWKIVRSNRGLSVYDFWERYYDEAYEHRDDYGEVSSEWIMDNFWNGIEYSTNGWPLSKSAEYLQVYKKRTISARKIAQDFIDDYIEKDYYNKYVDEELDNIK